MTPCNNNIIFHFFIPLLLLTATITITTTLACIECENAQTSEFIDPNKFDTDGKFSDKKIFDQIWYEHILWAEPSYMLAKNDVTLKSFTFKFDQADKELLATAKYSAKDGKQCISYEGTLSLKTGNPTDPRNLRLTINNQSSSLWLLDKYEDDQDFLLQAMCNSLYKRKWASKPSECPDGWTFSLFHTSSKPRNDEHYAAVEAELEMRICYPVAKLVRTATLPSTDCLRTLRSAAAGISCPSSIRNFSVMTFLTETVAMLFMLYA